MKNGNTSAAVMNQRAPRLVEADDDTRARWRALDWFATPPWATRALGEIVHAIDPGARTVWEPACGDGIMAAVLEETFDCVFESDIAPQRARADAAGTVGSGVLERHRLRLVRLALRRSFAPGAALHCARHPRPPDPQRRRRQILRGFARAAVFRRQWRRGRKREYEMKSFFNALSLRCLSAGALALSLAACSTAGSGGGVQIGGQNSLIGDAVAFTNADLDNTLAIARANITVSPNKFVVQCIPTFKGWLNSLPGAGAPITVSGLASGFETGLVLINGVQAGIPDAVYQDCGPLYAKVHLQIARLIAGGALLPKL